MALEKGIIVGEEERNGCPAAASLKSGGFKKE
jgi:hypothetical protein